MPERRGLLGLLVALLLWPGLAAARGIVLDADSRITDQHVILDADASIVLDADVIEALDSGIPLHFVWEARLSRSRRYWVGGVLAETRRTFVVARHALSERYTLVEIGSTRAQTFKTVEEVLAALGSLPEILTVERTRLDAGASYIAQVRIRLSVEELPAPMRPTVWISPAWWVSSGWHEWTLRP